MLLLQVKEAAFSVACGTFNFVTNVASIPCCEHTLNVLTTRDLVYKCPF